MEISEEIKLIAEFVGMKELAVDLWVDAHTEQVLILGEYRPHEDWNELMPVVEKIEAVGGAINIDAGNVFLHFPDGQKKMIRFDYEKKSTKIKATFQASIQFIQWYNSLTPKDK